MNDPAGLRRDYGLAELGDGASGLGWFELLRAWFDAALATPAIIEPNAIQLATVDAAGRPSVRTVLVKALDEAGIVFYTGHHSAKGTDLAAHPYAAAVFAWLTLERQVRLSGPVAQVTRAETEAYFASRPRGSQLAAWASAQSEVIDSRASLEEQVRAVEQRFAGVEVPAPPDWGGYRLRPSSVEFWQGRHDRLHDRLRYRIADHQDGYGEDGDGGAEWIVERLQP